MSTYRDGGSMTKLGNFMVATGGRQFPRSLNTIEVMSTRRPGKWRMLSKFQLVSYISIVSVQLQNMLNHVNNFSPKWITSFYKQFSEQAIKPGYFSKLKILD